MIVEFSYPTLLRETGMHFATIASRYTPITIALHVDNFARFVESVKEAKYSTVPIFVTKKEAARIKAFATGLQNSFVDYVKDTSSDREVLLQNMTPRAAAPFVYSSRTSFVRPKFNDASFKTYFQIKSKDAKSAVHELDAIEVDGLDQIPTEGSAIVVVQLTGVWVKEHPVTDKDGETMWGISSRIIHIIKDNPTDPIIGISSFNARLLDAKLVDGGDFAVLKMTPYTPAKRTQEFLEKSEERKKARQALLDSMSVEERDAYLKKQSERMAKLQEARHKKKAVSTPAL